MSAQQIYDRQSAEHTQTETPPLLRSRSNTSTSNAKGRPRPKSRGSTTSLQSVDVGESFQPQQQQIAMENGQQFMPQGSHPYQQMYQQNPEDALLHYGQQTVQPQNAGGLPDMRPQSQHGFQEMQQYPMHYANGMPVGLPQQHMHHMRHASEVFEGSPAPEDSENPDNGGAKRRKGTASSLANDQELRRLLTQYQGKSLKDVASEVQRNEGSGGKSEKAKQVFAMLWLQETCRRSTNSVRRDRVFSRYTERCGNERVPTLNPASFGKLVRIIFPNVQTRRLGVRGESKYHYVDLSLFPDDGDSYLSQPPVFFEGEPEPENLTRDSSSEGANKVFQAQSRPGSSHKSQTVLDSADFPAPSASFLPRPSTASTRPGTATQRSIAMKMDCHYLNTPIVRIPTNSMSSSLVSALPCVLSTLPATLSSYLSMPSSESHTFAAPSSQDSFKLPDINSYLAGTSYDRHNADALSHLYRSYCIDVIDAFRKVKEKPFFNHHSAYNGKMTVPVAKLFQLEALSPWIKECDMLMYKQMIRFIAPLALQVVPEEVWAVFDRISVKLVNHIVGAFEEKCPIHVVVAKIVPAARFANLLKKLRSANAAALHVSGMLEDEKMRTQMWVDFVSMVNPHRVVDDSLPPPESLSIVEGTIRHDLRTLVSPMDDDITRVMENEESTNAFVNFLVEQNGTHRSERLMPCTGFDYQSVSPLERWVQWLERVPQAFDKHHPQCLINWHMGFWKSVMTQLGIGGASTYQAWWYLEAFLSSMLGWLTQMEGLLMDEAQQIAVDKTEEMKKKQDEKAESVESQEKENNENPDSGLKRKRTEEDVGGQERQEGRRQPNYEPTSTTSNPARVKSATIGFDGANPNEIIEDDDDDAEMNEIRRGGPLDLPSFSVRGSSPAKGYSPVKRQVGLTLGLGLHDDSGIDLREDASGHDKHVMVDLDADLKRLKREWGILSSDAIDGESEVVVI